jgi:hypothetical protein
MPLIKWIRLEALMTSTLSAAKKLLVASLGIAASLLFSGCDQLGIETPARLAAAADAEGKAVGSACRQAGRAIEDCFTLNPKANKAAVFGGWREMNDYMTKNKIDVVVPQFAQKVPGSKEKASKKDSHEESATNAEAAPAADSHATVASEPPKRRKNTEVAQVETPVAPTSRVAKDAHSAPAQVASAKSSPEAAGEGAARPSHRVIPPPVSESDVELARQRAHTP